MAHARQLNSGLLEQLYQRPGFMIRRAYQLTVAIFADELAATLITPTQYGILCVLAGDRPIDQAGVARLLGLDRSNAGYVVSTLEKRGLLLRTPGLPDRRRMMLALTDRGRVTLDEATALAEHVPVRTLAMFTDAEREQFLVLLGKLVAGLSSDSTLPFESQPSD
ncbi:MAG: MarR family winged helix-turn-helix transcriptional regulator [Janthinobacterium lividum]